MVLVGLVAVCTSSCLFWWQSEDALYTSKQTFLQQVAPYRSIPVAYHSLQAAKLPVLSDRPFAKSAARLVVSNQLSVRITVRL